MLDKSRNYLISNVELNWAKLNKPVNPFGTEQWELQVATTDKKKAKELSQNFLNVKEKDGKYIVSLKRKAMKSDGTPNNPPRVVDGKRQELDMNEVMIGNGSIGSVIVYQYNYDMAGRKGVGSSLSAVQVAELKQYTGTDFDIIDGPTTAPDESEDTASSADLF
jgi:hypothetical protein